MDVTDAVGVTDKIDGEKCEYFLEEVNFDTEDTEDTKEIDEFNGNMLEAFGGELMRLLNNSGPPNSPSNSLSNISTLNNSSTILVENSVISMIKSLEEGEEAIFLKICTGTATEEEIKEWSEKEGMDPSLVQDILVPSFRIGQDIAADIDNQKKDIDILQKEMLSLKETDMGVERIEDTVLDGGESKDESKDESEEIYMKESHDILSKLDAILFKLEQMDNDIKILKSKVGITDEYSSIIPPPFPIDPAHQNNQESSDNYSIYL